MPGDASAPQPPRMPLRIEPWHFRSVEQLQGALEKYHACGDGTVVRKYGDTMPGGDDTWSSETAAAYTTEVDNWRQKDTIKAGMRRLKTLHLPAFRLLDSYYRRPGKDGVLSGSENARGWLEALRYGGYIRCAQDRITETTFRFLRSEAIRTLLICTWFDHAPRS